MGPYVITERIGAVAYRLNLPQELADFHNVFHISVLRKVVKEPQLIIPHPPQDLEKNLTIPAVPREILHCKGTKGKGKSISKIHLVGKEMKFKR